MSTDKDEPAEEIPSESPGDADADETTDGERGDKPTTPPGYEEHAVEAGAVASQAAATDTDTVHSEAAADASPAEATGPDHGPQPPAPSEAEENRDTPPFATSRIVRELPVQEDTAAVSDDPVAEADTDSDLPEDESLAETEPPTTAPLPPARGRTPSTDDKAAFRLSDRAAVALTRRGTDLAVSFSSDANRLASFESMAERLGWSLLSVITDRPDTLRAEEITSFFDALTDGTLLDDFHRTLFLAAGEDGTAALGYAIAAPLSRVLALGSPGALPLEGRYPVRPDLLGATAGAWLIHENTQGDPAALDTLSDMPIGILRDPFSDDVLGALDQIGALPGLAAAAMDGELTAPVFHRLLRARRDSRAYILSLERRLAAAGRDDLRLRLGRHILKTDPSRYRKLIKSLRRDLAERGMTLPRPRPRAP